MNNMTINEFSERLNLPILDEVYPYTAYGFYFAIVLDESDNHDLIKYCEYRYMPYYLHMNNDHGNESVVITIRYNQYVELKASFPYLKVIGIAPGYETKEIDKDNIKEYYNSIKDKDCCTLACMYTSPMISVEIITIFSCFNVTDASDTTAVYIRIPDISTYNKLILMLGGNAHINLRQMIRKQ